MTEPLTSTEPATSSSPRDVESEAAPTNGRHNGSRTSEGSRPPVNGDRDPASRSAAPPAGAPDRGVEGRATLRPGARSRSGSGVAPAGVATLRPGEARRTQPGATPPPPANRAAPPTPDRATPDQPTTTPPPADRSAPPTPDPTAPDVALAGRTEAGAGRPGSTDVTDVTDVPRRIPAQRVIPAEPPPELVFKRKVRVLTELREVFGRRELIRSLVERDLRARYKQAVLGFSWALITPLILMVVFTVFFKRVANFDTGDVPYALFAYIGLVPWGFFSTSVMSGGNTLLSNQVLVNKVHCPREVFPIASVGSAAVDALFALSALFLLFGVYTFAPASTTPWFLVLLVIQIMFTLAVVLLLSILIVYLRDLRHLLPIILQFGLLGTPVAYPLSTIPSSWRGIYCAINPLAAVIDGYRRVVLFGVQPQWQYVALAAASSTVLLTISYRVFKRLEVGIADVA
jgi:ABC-type polysaccharide/polyol phosphate export permease